MQVTQKKKKQCSTFSVPWVRNTVKIEFSSFHCIPAFSVILFYVDGSNVLLWHAGLFLYIISIQFNQTLQIYSFLNIQIYAGHSCKFLTSFGSFDPILFSVIKTRKNLRNCSFQPASIKCQVSFLVRLKWICSPIFGLFFEWSLCDSAKMKHTSVFSSFDCESYLQSLLSHSVVLSIFGLYIFYNCLKRLSIWLHINYNEILNRFIILYWLI